MPISRTPISDKLYFSNAPVHVVQREMRAMERKLSRIRDGVLTLDLKSMNEYTFKPPIKPLDKVWLSFGEYSINIHKTDEGVVVDIFQKGKEDRGSLESCYAFDSEILSDEEYKEEIEDQERRIREANAGRTD